MPRRSELMQLINKLRNKTRKPYEADIVYQSAPADITERHCYVHPGEIATYYELNLTDLSYVRPVCTGCIDPEKVMTLEQLEKVV